MELVLEYLLSGLGVFFILYFVNLGMKWFRLWLNDLWKIKYLLGFLIIEFLMFLIVWSWMIYVGVFI
tara:strand:- start:5786 stop:5986 length:201 start_codon:yes stop_codon:yes gene_type:complete